MELEALGVPCAIHDLACNNAGELGLSGAIRDVFKYDTVVVGSPTYNNGIFPPVETFMKALQSRLVKGRRFFAFGSYTWSAASVRQLNELAAGMGFDVLADGLAFPQSYTGSVRTCSAPAPSNTPKRIWKPCWQRKAPLFSWRRRAAAYWATASASCGSTGKAPC